MALPALVRMVSQERGSFVDSPLATCRAPINTRRAMKTAKLKNTRRNLTSTRAKLAALRDGRELPLTADDVAFGTEVGDVPGPDVRAVLRLARAIHRTESTNVSISWPAQERAREFFNEHGLARTLDRATELEATVDGRAAHDEIRPI